MCHMLIFNVSSGLINDLINITAYNDVCINITVFQNSSEHFIFYANYVIKLCTHVPSFISWYLLSFRFILSKLLSQNVLFFGTSRDGRHFTVINQVNVDKTFIILQ